VGHDVGGAVGWGTALQAGRSRIPFPMVRLEFFNDIILPAALCPEEVDSAPNRNEYQRYFLGIKMADALGWQPYHFHVPVVLKSGTLRACPGISLPSNKSVNTITLVPGLTLGEINDTYKMWSPNIIRVIRWAARIVQKRNSYKVLVGKLEGKRLLRRHRRR